MTRRNRKRLVPLAVLPATTSAALAPVLHAEHVPDALLGGMMGVLCGLSLVFLFALARGGETCAKAG